MLRKILQKVFISKEFTQCKTSLTLKLDVFEIPDNKNIGKLFSKYELLFLHKASSRSDPSQILILRFPILRASQNLSPSLKFYAIQMKPPFNSILIIFFIGFPILSYRIRPHSTTSIGYTKPYATRSQTNLLSNYILVIILYGSNTQPIKKLSLYELLLFQSYITRSITTLSSTQSMVNSL